MSKETIFIGVINLLFFYFLWFWGYRIYFTHSFRHYLFGVRDELFDFAAKGNIDFNNKAFLRQWNEINAMIQRANDTFVLFFSSLFISYKNKNFNEDYLKLIEKEQDSLTDAQKEFLMQIREKQLNLFVGYLLKSSFAFLFIAIIVSFVVIIKQKTTKRSNLKTNITNKVEPYFEIYNELATIN